MKIFYVTLLFVLVMEGCVSPKFFSEAQPANESDQTASGDKPAEFHQHLEASIPLTFSSGASGEVNADIFRPIKRSEPKTLVIMVPGSGNVSRRGEVVGDGIENFKTTLEMNLSWAKALSDKGLFVLSYDKRTCTGRTNSLCRTNDQSDIDKDGILALARDLDQIYLFAKEKLDAREENSRIVLMSTSQGAQVISLSQCAKNVSGVVLLSPVIGDLETMWIAGLARASEMAERGGERNQLINRKESMTGFFTSLKRGDFPENAHVRGATITFWKSWIDATKNTTPRLKANGRPSLVLFSAKDPLTPKVITENLRKESQHSTALKVKTLSDNDRNFVSAEGVPDGALREVMSFVKTLPPVKL